MTFTTFPIPSISTTTSSPSFNQTGGFIPKPTPPGVPVMIKLPACSVWPVLKKETNFLTPNTRSPVSLSCLTSPLTLVFNFNPLASPNTSVEVMQGPSGAYLSKLLLKLHCGIMPALSLSICQSRHETSFPEV